MSSSSTGSNLINTGALLRAAGIGVAVAFVLQIVSTGIGVAAGSVAAGANSSNAGTMATVFGALGVCLCCFTLLFFGGIGAGYGWFAGKSGSPLEAGPMALGGALSAFIAGILMGICGAGASFLTTTLKIASQAGGSLGGAATGLPFGIAGAGFGLVFGVCIYPIIFAILGAAGGAIYAMVVSNRSKPQPAAM